MMKELHLTVPHFQSGPSRNKAQCKVHMHTHAPVKDYSKLLGAYTQFFAQLFLAATLEVHAIH